MTPYLNRSGNSPITHYHIADTSITVRFDQAKQDYRYSYTGGAGKAHVEEMKELARSGSGLSAYITHNVRKSYDR